MLKIEVFSFDIYDTCISRNFASPRDLFFSLGLRLANKYCLPQEINAVARVVARLRIRGEKVANYFRENTEAIDIGEIYRHIVIPKGLGFSAMEMMALELEMERNSVYPIRRNVERIQALRKEGNRIVFISDMYLDANFLRPILKKFSLIESNETIYVSSEVGLTKRSGNLFRHVLKMEAIKPGELLHIGDDLIADIERPRRLGINVEHFRFSHLNRFEKAILSTRNFHKSVASKAPAISRQVRLNFSSEKNLAPENVVNFLSSSVAPLLTAYVGWVLFEANKLKINRLYFVARDGEVLLKIARILAERIPTPELRYLHGSRRAWLVPSISFVDLTWKRLVTSPTDGSSKFDILSRVGMNLDEIVTTLERQSMGMDSALQKLTSNESVRYLDSLLENSITNKIIVSHIQRERDMATGYFLQEGLLDSTTWALVDVGWSLNSHAALRRILRFSEPENSPNLNSFSIGFAKDRLPECVTGLARAMLPEVGSFLSRRRSVIEHIFTPSMQPTSIGYCKEGNAYRPSFGTETRSRMELAYAALVHDIACDYAKAAIACDEIWEHFDQYRGAAVKAATNFIFNPTAEEAESLKGFFAITDIRQEKSQRRELCRPLTIQDLLLLAQSPYKLKSSSSLGYIPLWLEGSAALSPKILRTMIRSLLGLQRFIICRS